MADSLPVMDMTDNPTGCCPRFDPAPWNDREFSLEGLTFAPVETRSFFYVPLNMSGVMARAMKTIAAAGQQSRDRYLMLSREESPWRARHYILVNGPVAGFEAAELPGTWYARVFEGSYGKMGAWFKEMNSVLEERGTPSREFLSFYTTCPKCAKAYGKNYVVLFARVR